MAYCTLSDLTKLYGETYIRDLANDNGMIDTDKVDAAIAEAESMINPYIEKVINLPLDDDSIPPKIKSLAIKLARIELCKTTDNLTESIVLMMQQLEKELEMIGDGRIGLGIKADDSGEVSTGYVTVIGHDDNNDNPTSFQNTSNTFSGSRYGYYSTTRRR